MKQKHILKKILPILFTLIFLMLFGCLDKTTETAGANTGLYPFETAVIQYKISGSSDGTQTLYIKNGMTATEKHTKNESAGYEQFENTLTINSGEFIYVVDLDSNKGTKTKNTLWTKISGLNDEERLDLGKKLVGGLSADSEGKADQLLQSLGSETVTGEKCEKYNTLGLGTVCVWQNVPLKTQINVAGIETLIEATSVKENESVDDSKFQVPANVQLSEINI
jgi:hypothetical protein